MNSFFLKKKEIYFFCVFSFSVFLLSLFQNCQSGMNTNNKMGDNAVDTSSTLIDPPPSTIPNPCPPSNMGNPIMSNVFISGTSVAADTVTFMSGYTNDSGNTSSNPTLELSLLQTNVTPENVCNQSVNVQCGITINEGSTGILWGTNDRVPINRDDFNCTTSNNILDLDAEGLTPTSIPNKTTVNIRPRNQAPDISSNTHVCMQGSGTIRLSLISPYNKTSNFKEIKFNFTNTCPFEQKLNASAEAEAQGLFGDSVSISGTRAAVLNAGLNAYGLANVGGVRIYELNGSNWDYKAPTLIPPVGELESNAKPNSVLLDGSHLFLGNAAINGQSGRVWYFTRDTSGNWNKSQTLNGDTGSKFGTSLYFNGTYLFVGAPGTGGIGAVRIYSLSGSTLTLVKVLNGTDANSDFGASVSGSGARLAIGAPGSVINTSTTGHFFICDISNLSSASCTPWALTNNKLGTETIPLTSRLGSSIALKSNLLLVSAKNWYSASATTPPAIRNGLVALIDLNTTSNNVKIFKGASEELYGSSIAFGSTSFFIGAKEAIAKRGRVLQMALPSDGSINATHRYNYYGLNQGPQDRFGAAISVNGNKLLVGAPLDEELGFSSAGSITFFNIINP